MRPLLKLNPYFAKYPWHLLLGVVFIVLSNLFAVYAPQVVREAIDLIAEALRQRELPSGQRLIHAPSLLMRWVAWTGLDLEQRLNDIGGDA